jgi:glycerol-3-phosphate dehydrogenase (NAD(P)+)
MSRIAILGGGAWGTALALTAARAGHEAQLWARDLNIVEAVNLRNENPDYLPRVKFDSPVTASADAAEVMRGAALILAVIPAQSLRAALEQLAHSVPASVPLVLCAKGIERESGLLLSKLAAKLLPSNPIAVLSGPSFALDVARGLPTAVTVAAADERLAADIAAMLSSAAFRCYTTTDVIGVEAGGALKNVLAVAVGAARGRGLGASAEAALITRGFVELRRLAESFGARPETPLGLSGLGDLILTCSSPQSRNFSYGLALGRGESLEGRPLAEGVATAFIAAKIAKERGIEAPITMAAAAILEGKATIDGAVAALLMRPLKAETA